MQSLARLPRFASGLGAAALLVTGLAGCHSSSTTAPASTTPTCNITPPAPSSWRLVANGTTFQDDLGRVVTLRGVDAGGRSKFAPYVPFDYPSDAGYVTALDAYMDHAASWGIDVMRVPFTWSALEPTQGTNDADWLSRYDQLLDAAWARGIWTIIDFHQDIYSEVYCGDGFPGWTIPDAGPYMHDCPSWSLEYYNNAGVISSFDAFWDASAPEGGTPTQTQYVSAWDVMVARYKDKPGVLGFEPLNEPGWGSADETTFSATTLTAFYSMMVPHMRAAAPSSLVFIDPPGVDGTFLSTGLTKPTGDGIVFAPHYYPIAPNPSTDLVTWQQIGVTWNVPVFVGEFGASHAILDNTDYMTSIFDAFDALSLSGSEWEYSVEAEEWNSEVDSIVAADGGEYGIAKAVQRPFARAVAGSAIAQSYDGATFTLSFKPSSGATNVTEVALPPQAYAGYPAGYDTTVTGACIDSTSAPGKVLVQAAAGATSVSLKIAVKGAASAGNGAAP